MDCPILDSIENGKVLICEGCEDGKTAPNELHQRAAKFHELAAHAYRAAATHRGAAAPLTFFDGSEIVQSGKTFGPETTKRMTT